jgi:hypothetical protein
MALPTPETPPMWIDPSSAGAVMNGDKIQAVPIAAKCSRACWSPARHA